MTRSRNQEPLIFEPEIEATVRRTHASAKKRRAEARRQAQSNSQTSTMDQPNRTLRQSTQPRASHVTKGVKMPTTTAANFDIKPHVMNMITGNLFYGLEKEEPVDHLQKYIQTCSLQKINSMSDEELYMYLFRFSLAGKAQRWYNSLPDTIDTWEKLSDAFLVKFFPGYKTHDYKLKILTFAQEFGEGLNEAWERFKDYQYNCPHHGIDNETLMNSFYNGLDNETKRMVDGAAGGSFHNKFTPDAIQLLDTLAENQWNSSSRRVAPKKGKHEVETYSLLSSQIAALTEKIDGMRVGASSSMPVNAMATTRQGAVVCDYCGVSGHMAMECANNPNAAMVMQEQVNAFQGQSRPPFNNNSYYPGIRNHPNLSYRSNNVKNPQQQHYPQQALPQ